MHLKLRYIFFVFVSFLTGCTSTFHNEPYVMYEDKGFPLNQTSVLMTDGFIGNVQAQVVGVDGKPPSCWEVGCPLWVRVKPGDHRFQIKLNVYESVGFYRTGIAEVTIEDMKPEHVYKVNYKLHNDEFVTDVEDLGENPDYGVYIGRGKNRKYYRVSF